MIVFTSLNLMIHFFLGKPLNIFLKFILKYIVIKFVLYIIVESMIKINYNYI